MELAFVYDVNGLAGVGELYVEILKERFNIVAKTISGLKNGGSAFVKLGVKHFEESIIRGALF